MNDLEFALLLADAADEISLARFRALDLNIETKPDRTPVTDADRAAGSGRGRRRSRRVRRPRSIQAARTALQRRV